MLLRLYTAELQHDQTPTTTESYSNAVVMVVMEYMQPQSAVSSLIGPGYVNWLTDLIRGFCRGARPVYTGCSRPLYKQG